MNKKITAPIIIIVAMLLCCSIVTIQKNRANTQYEPSIEVAIEQNYKLFGQSVLTGVTVPIEVSVEKAMISSGAIALFQNYPSSEDITFLGVKDIAIHMKNGKVYYLWNNCKDKTISYDNQTNEAVTYILFPKTLPLKKIESIEVQGQKFEVNAEKV